jgi:molybdenum cofactor guanylyltransferase
MPEATDLPSLPHPQGLRAPAGVILAGGLSRRLGGGDKCLLDLGGEPILGRVIARLRSQVASCAVNANGDPARFARFGLPVVPDGIAGRPGPLAGILAGLDWAAAAGFGRIVTVAADTPFFPDDLVARLDASGAEAPVVLAATDQGDLHPVFGLWSVSLRTRLRADILAGARRVGDWAGTQGCVRVDFPVANGDPFFNINTKDDLAGARARLETASRGPEDASAPG